MVVCRRRRRAGKRRRRDLVVRTPFPAGISRVVSPGRPTGGRRAAEPECLGVPGWRTRLLSAARVRPRAGRLVARRGPLGVRSLDYSGRRTRGVDPGRPGTRLCNPRCRRAARRDRRRRRIDSADIGRPRPRGRPPLAAPHRLRRRRGRSAGRRYDPVPLGGAGLPRHQLRDAVVRPARHRAMDLGARADGGPRDRVFRPLARGRRGARTRSPGVRRRRRLVDQRRGRPRARRASVEPGGDEMVA